MAPAFRLGPRMAGDRIGDRGNCFPGAVAPVVVVERGHVGRAKDPGFLAIKRSIRAAVVMPIVFGLTHVLFSDPQVSLFGAFGSFALLLLVDFPGRPRTRLISYVALAFAGSCFIALGTVASTHKVAAVAAMAVVGFGVLFAGIESPQAATASTAALLLFVLPVAVAQPPGEVGPRLIGWVFAAAFCIPACMLLWPTPWHDDLRRRLSATISVPLRRLALPSLTVSAISRSRGAVESELVSLRDSLPGPRIHPRRSGERRRSGQAGRSCRVGGRECAGLCEDVGHWICHRSEGRGRRSRDLRLSGSLVCDGVGHPVDDAELVGRVQDSIQRLDGLIKTELDGRSRRWSTRKRHSPGVAATGAGESRVSTTADSAPSLGPDFPVSGPRHCHRDGGRRGARGRRCPGRRRQEARPGDEIPRAAFWRRLTSHLSFRSVWFRNALRGAAGLALAVAVVEIAARRARVLGGAGHAVGPAVQCPGHRRHRPARRWRARPWLPGGSAIMIGVGGHRWCCGCSSPWPCWCRAWPRR